MIEDTQAEINATLDHVSAQRSPLANSQTVAAASDTDVELMNAGELAAQQTRQRKAKETRTSTRVPGKSVFPVSRVQRILKADKVCLRALLASNAQLTIAYRTSIL